MESEGTKKIIKILSMINYIICSIELVLISGVVFYFGIIAVLFYGLVISLKVEALLFIFLILAFFVSQFFQEIVLVLFKWIYGFIRSIKDPLECKDYDWSIIKRLLIFTIMDGLIIKYTIGYFTLRLILPIIIARIIVLLNTTIIVAKLNKEEKQEEGEG